MRYHSARRKLQILETGLVLWPNVTARNIGRTLSLSHAAVLYHFGTSGALRDAIAALALQRRDARIVPALIIEGHASVAGLSSEERMEYLVRA